MKYIVVHEFFHHAEKNSVKNIPSPNLWIKEGMAKMFEDIVYDGENPFLVYGNRGLFKDNLAEDILTNITEYGDRYRTFMFWKLMQEKCKPYFSVLIGSNNPLSNLNSATQNCTEISNLSNDKLVGAFVLYNHAMILHNNLRFIEGGEPSSIASLNKKVKKVDSPKFKGTLDMSSIVIPKYGAKSFLITHETLTSDADMNLTFKSSGDLKLVAVRVKADGSSDVDDNFVMKSNDTVYELTDADRNGSLFITIVNTTGADIKIDELKISKAEFKCESAYTQGSDIMATYCSYSLNDEGHFWLKDGGFIHIPSGAKSAYANNLASEYKWCGVYGSSIINSWEGVSYCREAHVYWSQESTKDRSSPNSQKQSVSLYKPFIVENNDKNESYLTN
jgi:hypothetical protein